jgi:hypothetical protein
MQEQLSAVTGRCQNFCSPDKVETKNCRRATALFGTPETDIPEKFLFILPVQIFRQYYTTTQKSQINCLNKAKHSKNEYFSEIRIKRRCNEIHSQIGRH